MFPGTNWQVGYLVLFDTISTSLVIVLPSDCHFFSVFLSLILQVLFHLTLANALLPIICTFQTIYWLVSFVSNLFSIIVIAGAYVSYPVGCCYFLHFYALFNVTVHCNHCIIGSLPTEIGALTKLSYLYLNDNFIGGEREAPQPESYISFFIFIIVILIFFLLYYDLGSLPSTLSLATKLVWLDFNNNFLTGGSADRLIWTVWVCWFIFSGYLLTYVLIHSHRIGILDGLDKSLLFGHFWQFNWR